jgi:hypothetical protein
LSGSRLKINYHKSETFIFSKEEEEKVRLANMLNCKLGKLPMTYISCIPISDTKLGMGALSMVTKKVSNRVPPWKAKHISYGGRLILSNSCLSSLPTYMMGFYLLPLENHRKMDTARSRFFWRGVSGDFKYHMVRWEAICRPKEFGGLGVVNTQVFNECLMSK